MIKRIYERVRPYLPRKFGVYDGVAIRKPRLFDRTDTGNLEPGEVQLLKQAVDSGDTVVVLGGGWGITTVHASRLAGEAGEVIVYEAADSMAETARETVEVNQTDAPVRIKHAAVGPVYDAHGDATNAPRVHPYGLPQCDVLTMDIEGAETAVIGLLDDAPETVIVEYHGNEDAVRRLLDRRGYGVTDTADVAGPSIGCIRFDR